MRSLRDIDEQTKEDGETHRFFLYADCELLTFQEAIEEKHRSAMSENFHVI